MKRLSDQTLVMLYVCHKDNQYLTHLYNRHRKWVYQICLSYCKDPEYAKDLTQEIFIRLINNLDRFSGKATFTTWLWSITTNYCNRELQKVKRSRVIHERYQVENEDLITNESDTFLLIPQQMEQVISLLPAYQQNLLRIKYCDGLSVESIANSQQLTVGTVKMRLQRARDRARTLYKKLHQPGETNVTSFREDVGIV
ncbi:RNA polymerase sigma factor [Spirosoma gilvum]